MNKAKIWKMGQVEHIIAEATLLSECEHPFIVRMVRAFEVRISYQFSPLAGVALIQTGLHGIVLPPAFMHKFSHNVRMRVVFTRSKHAHYFIQQFNACSFSQRSFSAFEAFDVWPRDPSIHVSCKAALLMLRTRHPCICCSSRPWVRCIIFIVERKQTRRRSISPTRFDATSRRRRALLCAAVCEVLPRAAMLLLHLNDRCIV